MAVHKVRLGRLTYSMQIVNGALEVEDYDFEASLIAATLSSFPSYEAHFFQVLTALVASDPTEEALIAQLDLISIHAPLSPRATTGPKLLETSSPLYLAIGAYNEDRNSRMACAQNENTHRLTANFLSRDKDSFVVSRVASHPNLPHTAMERLFKSSDAYVIKGVLQNPSISLELLKEYSMHANADFRQNVARHHKSSPEILSLLAHDPGLWVRCNVAINPSTPAEILRELFENNQDHRTDLHHILGHMSANPNLPEDLIPKFFESGRAPDHQVNLVSNFLSLPHQRFFAQCAPSVQIRLIFLTKEAEILNSLALSSDIRVRRAVANNIHTPLKTLKDLSCDDSLLVREVAKEKILEIESNVAGIEI